MKPLQRTIPILVILLTILSLLLTACGPVENQHGGPNSHKDRGSGKGPDHRKDKSQNSQTGGQAGKFLICHQTGSAENPYVQISVANDALKDGHGSHAGDFIPAPTGGCPKSLPGS